MLYYKPAICPLHETPPFRVEFVIVHEFAGRGKVHFYRTAPPCAVGVFVESAGSFFGEIGTDVRVGEPTIGCRVSGSVGGILVDQIEAYVYGGRMARSLVEVGSTLGSRIGGFRFAGEVVSWSGCSQVGCGHVLGTVAALTGDVVVTYATVTRSDDRSRPRRATASGVFYLVYVGRR